MRPQQLLQLSLIAIPLVLAGCNSEPARDEAPAARLVPLPPLAPPPASPPHPAPPVATVLKCPVTVDDAPPEIAHHAVEAAMQAYAAALKDGTPKDVAAHFTAEGELQLPDLAALHGRKAIIDFLTPLAGDSAISQVRMHTDLLDVHGPIANQWGTYDQDAGPRGKPPEHFHGRYSAAWKLEADGSWRIVRLMMQPLPAAAIQQKGG